ncbi:MAG: N-acyl homoserine lactonase family protein [Pseudomonadota bacterium]
MRATYDVFAIRYARATRAKAQCFIGETGEGTVEMAYYVWLIRGAGRTILVDTGFDQSVAKARDREFLICPGAALQQLGVAPSAVDTVILTHLHHDHAGNHHLFKDATFHIQAAEMAYTTGPFMTFKHLRAGYGAADLKVMIDRLFADQLVFHEGHGIVAPGIEVVHIGGHTAGLQSVVVSTARGPLVLASDAAVFYEGIATARVFPPAFHGGDELKGHKTLISLAGDERAIIPGHDAAVMTRYPAAIEGVAWRVDGVPLS